MRGKRVWRQLLTIAIVGAAAIFLYRTAAANWDVLQTFDWRVRPGLLALSIASHVGVLGFGVFLWSRVLAHFGGASPPFPSLLRIWSLSNTARYIPGGVWQFLAAAQLSRGAGLASVLALTSMVVHVLFSLLGAATITAAMLPSQELGLGATAAWTARLGVASFALAAVHPRVINGALGLVPRFIHRDVLRWHAGWLQGISLLLLANLSWLLYGVAYTLFIAALAPIPLAAYLPLTAVNALSFTAGYLAVLAPGGIGVRESAMTLLLTPILPLGVAAVVSVAARLWSIVAEVLLAGAAIILTTGRSPEGEEAREPLQRGAE